jgi:hypothetical protein
LLQELSIGDEWDYLESFFEFLASNASKLSVLRLGTLHQVSWMRHLPELLYLRKLYIDHIEQECLSSPFVEMGAFTSFPWAVRPLLDQMILTCDWCIRFAKGTVKRSRC